MAYTHATRRGAVAAALVILGGLAAMATADDGDTVHASGLSLAAHLDTAAGGDIAFWGDLAVLVDNALDNDPSNDGITVVSITNPTEPRVLSEFRCAGSAWDVGVWRDLVVLSVDNGQDRVEYPRVGPACGPAAATEASFQGVRVLSIANPARPVWLADVRTPNGSHTHTLLPDLDHQVDGRAAARLLVYSNNGPSPATEADPRGLESIIEVPVNAPHKAQRLAPAVLPHTPATGNLPPGPVLGDDEDGDGGGDGGSFNTPPNLGCHDLTVLVSKRLAACSGIQPDTQLWDLTNPVRPVLLSIITNPVIEHHHSTGFSWDGNTLVIVEESASNHAGGRCHTGTGSPKAALWFYDISNPRTPVLRNWFQAKQPGNAGYCTPHYFNIVPLLSGRDVLVSSWAGAGTSVVDFTDPSNPKSLGHFNVQSADPNRRSFSYASYWYNGYIYVNNARGVIPPIIDIGSKRGLDVLRVDIDGLDDDVLMHGFSHGTQDCQPARPACAALIG